MPAKGIGLHEIRTRVICHLPLNDDREEHAVLDVIRYVREQRTQGLGVQGYMHSVLRPAVYKGYWWSEEENDWFPDDIVLVIVDYKLAFDDPLLSAKVKQLKQAIRRSYRRHGKKQEEVWVVAQQIIRQD